MTPFKYISWGCGLQSTVLVEMVCEGTLKCDAVFFADTLDEPYWVYETLGYWWLRCPVPVYVVSKGKMSEHMRQASEQGKRWATIPGWTLGNDVDAGMTAQDCSEFLLSRGLPVPRKSSCRYCPYHSDRYWRDMKANEPQEFAAACDVDVLIRNLSKVGVSSPVFIHRSLVPLSTAYFGEDQRELFREDCSGHCGV